MKGEIELIGKYNDPPLEGGNLKKCFVEVEQMNMCCGRPMAYWGIITREKKNYDVYLCICGNRVERPIEEVRLYDKPEPSPCEGIVP